MQNRRAVSGILEAVFLVGIVTISCGIVAVYVHGLDFDTMSCEVQLLKVYKVNDDDYWVELILYNNGDYTFDATLKYFDNITITNLSYDDLIDVRPMESANLEFQFTGVIGDSVTMGFDVTTDNQKSTCIKEVKI